MKKKLFQRSSGQGLTEYAIVLSLVAVAAIASTAFLGGVVKSRVAALAGAVAGESKEKIDAENERALKAAAKASQSASSVGGMKFEHGGGSGSEGAELIDDVGLDGGE
jgi:Flp pilus assembly pilin Flp